MASTSVPEDSNNTLDEMADSITLTGTGEMYTKHGWDQTLMLDKVGDDEPIFILRARDELAIDTITFWISFAKTRGVNEHKTQEAELHREAFIRWAQDHDTKLPD